MNKQLILKRMAACATLAMMFGGAIAQNATGAATTGSMSGNSATAASTTAASGSAAKVASADQKMMRDIAHANLSEIAAGKMALEKSQSDDVKTFAQKMIDDHTKAQQELQTLADGKGVKLPTEPDGRHKAMAKMMAGLKGDAFDKRYLKQGGLSDHQAAHKLLERVQGKAKDADLKAYAAKTITAVDQHMTMAQEVSGKHGVGNPRKSAMTGGTSDTGTGSSRSSGPAMSGASGTGGMNGSGGMTGGSATAPGAKSGAATGGTSGGAAR